MTAPAPTYSKGLGMRWSAEQALHHAMTAEWGGIGAEGVVMALFRVLTPEQQEQVMRALDWKKDESK